MKLKCTANSNSVEMQILIKFTRTRHENRCTRSRRRHRRPADRFYSRGKNRRQPRDSRRQILFKAPRSFHTQMFPSMAAELRFWAFARRASRRRTRVAGFRRGHCPRLQLGGITNSSEVSVVVNGDSLLYSWMFCSCFVIVSVIV